MNLEHKELKELFELSKKIGGKRYNKLTAEDLNNYLKYDRWRFINGDGECGTTDESKAWVQEHSDWYCPICSEKYCDRGGKTIDHKLPRSQYPWLSLEWSNLWVICRACNREKGEKNWYEYEHFMFINYPHDYPLIRSARPIKLLNT
jgi:5-methylcytosine-specific restriction endonuclease McrA